MTVASIERRLARAATGDPLLGDGEGYVPLAAADPSLTNVETALSRHPVDLPDPSTVSARRLPREQLAFGTPLARPGKLFGIGLNYADHAVDLDEDSPDEPASFFKPATALTGPGGPIRLPPTEITDHVTAEAELAVVIGRTCSDVPVDAVDSVIGGFVPVIDMTAEDVLRRNPRFLTRSKSFDSFLVMGSEIVVPDPGFDLDDVAVRTVVDDEVRAANTVANMHFSPRELVAFHSRVMTLEPGDVISTGTPGAHRIESGDTVRAEVDGVGSVSADVVG
jgi:2-keto-4-pentenoate hydratase/2-oxohepta-3-ene-1,7-dioic acid hydratase in catechol pathway